MGRVAFGCVAFVVLAVVIAVLGLPILQARLAGNDLSGGEQILVILVVGGGIILMTAGIFLRGFLIRAITGIVNMIFGGD